MFSCVMNDEAIIMDFWCHVIDGYCWFSGSGWSTLHFRISISDLKSFYLVFYKHFWNCYHMFHYSISPVRITYSSRIHGIFQWNFHQLNIKCSKWNELAINVSKSCLINELPFTTKNFIDQSEWQFTTNCALHFT